MFAKFKRQFVCRDEAVHAYCAAAEAGLPAPGTRTDARGDSLTAKPAIGQLHASMSLPAQSTQLQPVLPPVYGNVRLPSANLQRVQQQQQQQQQQQLFCSLPAADTLQAYEQRSNAQHASQHHSALAQPAEPMHQNCHHQQHHAQTAQPKAAQTVAGHSFPQHSRLHLQPQPICLSHSSAPVSQPFNVGNVSHHAQHNTHVNHRTHNSGLTPQDIQHRARHFAQQMHLLPPLAPRHSRSASSNSVPYSRYFEHSMICLHSAHLLCHVTTFCSQIVPQRLP